MLVFSLLYVAVRTNRMVDFPRPRRARLRRLDSLLAVAKHSHNQPIRKAKCPHSPQCGECAVWRRCEHLIDWHRVALGLVTAIRKLDAVRTDVLRKAAPTAVGDSKSVLVRFSTPRSDLVSCRCPGHDYRPQL